MPPSKAGCATTTTAARCCGSNTRRSRRSREREGERILAEARQRFGVARVACAHRVGPLAIGELAVWVGVSAAHRGEAFDACRYIIDEVKHRVPIWKKEYYQDGDSGWVNCERCAAAAQASHRSIEREHRQADQGLRAASGPCRARRTCSW